MDNFITLLARVLLALLFVATGFAQLGHWHDSAMEYVQTLNLPAIFLPLVVAFQIGAGFALIAGVFTRWVSLALGIFCLATAVLFHMNFADPAQASQFLKNIAMAGGFLLLYVHGGGGWSLDAKFGKQARA